MRKTKEINCQELQSLCVKNGWFSNGDMLQYKKLFDMCSKGATVEDLSLIIWVCSNEKFSYRNILDTFYGLNYSKGCF